MERKIATCVYVDNFFLFFCFLFLLPEKNLSASLNFLIAVFERLFTFGLTFKK